LSSIVAVMLPPPVMLPPVVWLSWAKTGVIVTIAVAAAIMPNVATIVTATNNIFVFIFIRLSRNVMIYNNIQGTLHDEIMELCGEGKMGT
jgi:hypothetical protein